MILSQADLEEFIKIAQARAARIDALRKAIERRDFEEAIRLARAVCGMEAADEPQPDRRDPPLNR